MLYDLEGACKTFTEITNQVVNFAGKKVLCALALRDADRQCVQQPVDFPPSCQVRVEPVTCKVSLVLTDDPRLPCIPGEGNKMDPSHGEINLKLAN
ncbi:Prostate-associated microseminoprotein [Bagarius yarrelli]|uniref:Prostate-associated microseminoprotein n=1 Tax=Bagarius yarrelli TaxID=175774 RepID=A0A556U655_BAGYA|nr:Prostate-associated microseminoprotein [Bagarius yarrelli]